MTTIEQLGRSLADRYAVERLIGQGGMATVYLARDLRHDRPVALKVLNPELGAVLGVERFLSEIRVTANLQHPNLLPLFDSGEAGGLLFYVMPYVEGESLRARLEREKQLPIDDAVRIAAAVGDALDYAHGHGVIHRDLKPENILLQHGQPVVADFGIALAVTNAGGNRITQTGLSLGTPQYMSPEQATGDRVIDGRSDIYSLAAMTYEMLSGEPPHIGNTAQAIIARLLTDKPRSIRTMRSAVPEHVEQAVARGLEKLPADRFSTARQFCDALTGKTGAAPTTASRSTSAAPGWPSRLRDPLVLGLTLVTLAAITGLVLSQRRVSAPALAAIRFVLATPDSAPATDNFPWPAAISPNGQFVVYSAAIAAGATPQLWLLRTDQVYGHPIAGTEAAGQPAFSPDGQWLLFERANKEWKVRLGGGTPLSVSDGASYNGVDWTTNDDIVNGATGNFHGITIYSASGGERAALTHPDSAHGEFEHLWPIAFPDGKAIVFTIWKGGLSSSELAIARIPSGQVTALGVRSARPLAVLDGQIVYLQGDGAVMAIAVNERAGRVSGRPTPVHDRVDVPQGNNGNSRIFVSSGGALVTSGGHVVSRLAWEDRNGAMHPITKEQSGFSDPRISPDGMRIAVIATEGDQFDVWILELRTGTLSRLTTVGAVSSVEWLDNDHVLFVSGGAGATRFQAMRQQASGATPAEQLFESSDLMPIVSAAPDGRSALVQVLRANSWDIARMVLDSGKTLQPFAATGANETYPRISPDGRWATYLSDETGRFEVYVRSYPNPATKVQISSGGSSLAAWSPDGRSVYYQVGSRLEEAHVSTTPTFHVLARDSAFAAGPGTGLAFTTSFEPTRDRNRLLIVQIEASSYHVLVVPNWITEFRARVSASRR